MNLDHLRYFEVLAQLEHYGKAAEKLHISQPNLTYAVSQIEQELGAPLFEKAGRSIRLTRYGHEFLRVVKSSLDVLDSGTRTVREASQNGGLILLGSIRTLGTTLVPDLMRDFQAQTDLDVRFQLRSENGFSASLLKAVEEKRLDFCFTSSPGNAAVFESFSFHRKPFVVITPLGHPLSSRQSVALQDTLPYPQICFASCSGLRKNVDALFSQIHAAPTVAMETEEDAVIAGLVASGFGIAVLPDDPLFQSLPLTVLPLTSPVMAQVRRPVPFRTLGAWPICPAAVASVCRTLPNNSGSSATSSLPGEPEMLSEWNGFRHRCILAREVFCRYKRNRSLRKKKTQLNKNRGQPA